MHWHSFYCLVVNKNLLSFESGESNHSALSIHHNNQPDGGNWAEKLLLLSWANIIIHNCELNRKKWFKMKISTRPTLVLYLIPISTSSDAFWNIIYSISIIIKSRFKYNKKYKKISTRWDEKKLFFGWQSMNLWLAKTTYEFFIKEKIPHFSHSP